MSSIHSASRSTSINTRLRADAQGYRESIVKPPVESKKDTGGDSSGSKGSDAQQSSHLDSFAKYKSPWMLKQATVIPKSLPASNSSPTLVETPKATTPPQSTPLERTTDAFEQRFSDVASDPEAFHVLMQKAFGDNYDKAGAEQIRQQTLSGDFSWMPKIEVVDAAVLADTSGTQDAGVGLGAYSASTDTIYISRELLAGDPDKAVALLTEEVGHAIDARINTSDAAGDEGELFARSLAGEDLSVSQIAAIRSENDSGIIVIDGQEVEVEYGWLSKAWKGVKKAVSGVVDGVKNVVSNVVETVKTGIEKVVNSELIGKIMTVAQFIPIPIVQVVAKGYNVLKAGYATYQGIKHGSFAMIAGGIAGIAGGVAGVGGALGSKAAWVTTAANISKTASNISMAHQVIKERSFAGAAQLAANFFGADSKAATTLGFVARADTVVKAVENDDIFGVISSGTGLLQDFTGAEGDAILSKINEHSNVFQKIDNARKTGEYGQALGLLNDTFGGFDLPAGTQEVLNRIENGIKFAENVDNLIDGNNYAEAATMLLGQVSSQVENPQTIARIQSLSDNLNEVDTAVTAFEEGRFDDVIKITSGVLGKPLGEKTSQFVTDLQQRANNVEDLAKAVKTGDVQTTFELLNETLGGVGLPAQATATLGRIENGVRFVEKVDNLLDSSNYTEAAKMLLGAVSSKVDNPVTIGKIETLSNNFTKVDTAVKAFEKGRFDDVIKVTSDVIGKPLGDKTTQFVTQLQQRANNVEALVSAVKDGDVQSSAALLSGLTNGRLDKVTDVFESVDVAVNQVESLSKAIKNKDYSSAASLAASLSQNVVGSNHPVSNSLQQLSDVLTGKVQILEVPGATPGILPMMANELGVPKAGQTALAGQPVMVEIPASSKLELTLTEQAAVDRIEGNLSQGITDWDVGKAELQDINTALGGLTADQKTNVIASLSTEQLQTWGKEIDGFRGGLSDAEQVELFTSLARDLDPIQVKRVYNSFGQELVEKVHNKAIGTIDAPDSLTAEEKELYLDLAQMSLDVVGIFDPTPISDGTNTVISLARGKWLDAGLSAVSMVPYIGDLAKAGKLGSWAKTVEDVIATAAKNEKFAEAVEPVLSKISDAIEVMPSVLPGKLGETIGAVKSQIDNFSTSAVRVTTAVVRGGKGNNTVEWLTDSQGRVVEARSTLTETFGPLTRGAAEKEAQNTVASRGIDGDHGGHIVPHRLVGDQGAVNMFPQNGVREINIDTSTGRPVIDPNSGQPEILKNFNGSAYKTMENEIVDWIDAGATVEFKVRFTDFDGARPGNVHYDYVVKNDTGIIVHETGSSFKNQAGEVFDRISKADIAILMRGSE